MKKLFAFAGAGLLMIGCFLPIISVPDGTLTFFNPLPVPIPGIPENSLQYAGIAIILIGVISILLTLTNKTKFLWISGIATGVILAGVYWGFHAKLDEMKTQADQQMTDLFGGMLRGLTDSLFQAVELGGAGWYVTGSGAALLIIASILKSNINS